MSYFTMFLILCAAVLFASIAGFIYAVATAQPDPFDSEQAYLEMEELLRHADAELYARRRVVEAI